jgi:hypothetical protein
MSGFINMQTIQVDGLDRVIREMEDMKTIGDKRHREIKREIKKAAKPMKEIVKATIKDGKRKSSKSSFIAKGTDRKTGLSKHLKVDYRPGNLARSIDIFTSRKGLSVHVGARFGRKARSNADGFYAAMVHYGVYGKAGKTYGYDYKKRPNVGYADRAYLAGLSATEMALSAAVQKIIKKYITG